MGDRTALQATIYACPDEQRYAAAEALSQYLGEPDEGDFGKRYWVTDNTLNSDGGPIRRGEDALTLGTFATEAEAAEHIAGLPGADDAGRYSIDPVLDVVLGECYQAYEVSCGTADELGGALAELPGISFVLWEDPQYQWLGDLRAHTPELGLFAAACDANGNVCLQPAELLAIIARHETKAEIVAAVERATGKPWLDACNALDPNMLTGAAALTRGCEACSSGPGEECAPDCIGEAAHQDELAEGGHIPTFEPDAVYPHLARARCSCGWSTSGYIKSPQVFWLRHQSNPGAS